MTRALRLCLLSLAALAIVAQAAASPRARTIFPLREVRPGQRAVGKSVFHGTKIESFNIEIIGVLHKFDGTRSVILGRVLDGPVVTRKSGVISGMSGSPVYINGRLAGAIALAWSFSKEPITGITPIEEMLEALEERPRPEAVPVAGSSHALASPLRIGGTAVRSVKIDPSPTKPDPPGVMTLVPLSGLMQVSGFNQRGLERLAEVLSPYGLRVTQGPAGGVESMRPPVVPGAALGAQLISGDFDATALGTVTLVEGDRVLAFGHPLFQLGDIDLPMTGGFVHDILPSLVISDKIMSATQVVGRVSRDEQSAIAGELGGESDLLPMTVEVTDRDRGRSREFNVKIARIRELLPVLAAVVATTAIDETRGRISRGTARVIVEIEAEGQPTLRREDLTYSAADAAAAAAPAVLEPLAAFIDNPLGKLRFQRVRLRVETMQARRTAAIERVTVPQSRIEAGDEVALTVTLRPHGAPPVEVPMRLALPPYLPSGRVRIAITGGDSALAARGSIGAPRPRPVSLGQLVDLYLTEDRRQDLVLQASLPGFGAALLGEELPDFPAAAVAALRASRPTDLRPAPPVAKVVLPTEWVLFGRQTVSLMVEGAARPPGMAPPRPQPPGMPEDEEEEETAAFDIESPLTIATRPRWAGAGAGRPGAAAAAKEEEEEAKPLARQPEAFVHRARSDYAEAKTTDVAVGEEGGLSLAPGCTDLAEIPADVIWSLAVRDGAVYVGTGSRGAIHRVSAAGEVSEFFSTGEMNVHALAFDPEGNLYAATSPRGRLFRIAPDGAGKIIWDSDSRYLWCLTWGPEGELYVGAGSPAAVYAVSTDGQARLLANIPAANVLSLTRAPTGDLYAGTADQGVVYRVGRNGEQAAVCQVAGTSVDALALDEKGNIYASASPTGRIYQIPANGLPRVYCELDQKIIYGLAVAPNGDVAAVAGPAGSLFRAGSDRKPEALFRAETGIATALAAADGAMYVGGAAPSVLRKFGPGYAPSGALESPVFDADQTTRWGRMHLTAHTPTGTAVAAETRSGDSPDPEDHWTPWLPLSDGLVASRPSRYLQYRLTLTTDDPALTPVVRQVRLTYLPQNQPPLIALKEPSAGAHLAKEQALKWQAKDPDKDPLTFAVAISGDLGATWQELEKGLTEPKYDWDTTPTSDGRYLLRVTASDARSRPADPEEAHESIFVWVDNTAPSVLLFRSSLAVGDDRRARVRGVASDKLSAIQSIEYRVDDGEWESLPLSGIDSPVSDFSVLTEPLDAGTRDLEVRAFDIAGNVAEDKVEVEVKAADR